MKILFISQHYYPEHYSSTLLAEEFAKKGHEVTVLTCSFDGEKSETINNVNVVRLNCYLRKNDKRWSIIKSYLSFWHQSKKWVCRTRNNYDRVFSFGTSPVINLSAGNLYSKKHGVKHIGYVLDLWPESAVVTGYVKKNSLIYQVLKIWSKRIYQNLDNIVVGSPSHKEYFDNILKNGGSNIHYVPQPGFILKDEPDPYIYNNCKTNVIYFGNITKWQKIDLLGELGNFFNSHNVMLHVFGNGSYRNAFEKEISEQGYKNIILHDHVNKSELDRYVKGSDFIYVSLTNEGYVGKTIPHKLIQSLTYNKPIIAFIDGDGKDLLKKYDSGILPNSFDLHGLRELFEKALSLNELEKKKLGLNSLISYKENFDIQKVSNELITLLSK